MKKWWVVVALLLLSACGSNGGGGAVSVPTSGGSTPPPTDVYSGPTASVTIVVNRSASTNGSGAVLAAPVPTMARLSITNPNCNGVNYKLIVDLTIPGTASISIPIATGFTFEMVTYTVATAQTGTFNNMEEYAVTPNVAIVAGNNTITLTLVPITVGLTVPASLNSGQTYSAVYSLLTPSTSPFQTGWRLRAQTTNITSVLHLTGSYSATNSINMVAPVNGNQPATVYFQSEFLIKPSLVKTGELSSNWSFVYPNPLWGDLPISAPMSVPSGTVTITL